MEMGWGTSNPVPCILAGALGAVTAGATAANKFADAVVSATGTAEGAAMVPDSTAIDADVADAGPLVVSSRDPSPGRLPSTANWMAQIPRPLRVGGVDQGHEALSSLMVEGAWLHGEIINARGVAQQRTPSHEHLGKMRWVSSWLYPAAVAAHSQQRAGLPSLEGFALVRELSAGLDLRRDRVVIPVHTTDGGAEHWSLCVVHASSRQLLMCDSLAGANRECVDNHRAQAVLWWLQAVESADLRYQELQRQPWKVRCPPSTTQRQVQGDCGVFLCFWGSWAGSWRALSKAPPINPTCLRLRMANILLSTAAREQGGGTIAWANGTGAFMGGAGRSSNTVNGANFLAGEVLNVPRGRLGHGQDTVGRPPSHPLFMLGPVDDECDHARDTAWAVVFGACFRCLRKSHGGVDFVAEHPLSADFFRKQQAAAVKVMSRRPANQSFDALYRWDGAKVWRGKVPTDRHMYVSLMGRIKPSFGSPHFPCVLDDDDPGTAASTDSAPRHRVHVPGVQAMLMARLVAVAAWGPIGVNEEVDHGPAGAGVDAMWNLTVRSAVANKRRSSTIKRPSMAFAVVRTQLSADGPDEVGTVRMYPSPVSAAYALARGRVTRMAISAACKGTDPVFLGYS